MRASMLWRTFLLTLSASVALLPCSVPAKTVAYAERWLGGGFDYVRVNFTDVPERIGAIQMLTSVGAFVGDDYSHEYVIDEALGRLHTIDVLNASPTLIGTVSMSGNRARGMHWDPTTDQMFLIATDESCTTSTLYRLDVADASTVEVGTTPRCIVTLAIDGDGRAFGIDQTDAALVSIDTATGATTTIGPLGLDIEIIRGLDVDPESGLLYLFGNGIEPDTNGMFLVDTALGHATLAQSYLVTLLAIALAPAPDPIMASGFEAP